MLNNAPPMFNTIATDDFLFRSQFGVAEAWFKAGRPVEFIFTRMVATASALEIRDGQAIAGSMLRKTHRDHLHNNSFDRDDDLI